MKWIAWNHRDKALCSPVPIPIHPVTIFVTGDSCCYRFGRIHRAGHGWDQYCDPVDTAWTSFLLSSMPRLGNNKTPTIPTKTPFQLLNGAATTEHSQTSRLQACGNSLLSAGKCLVLGGLHVWACCCSAEDFPVDLVKAARVGVRRKTSDVDLSATGQGITLMLPGTL